MSKKLTIFALIAALVLAFAGSAFAAPVLSTDYAAVRSADPALSGDWSVDDTWAVPTTGAAFVGHPTIGKVLMSDDVSLDVDVDLVELGVSNDFNLYILEGATLKAAKVVVSDDSSLTITTAGTLELVGEVSADILVSPDAVLKFTLVAANMNTDKISLMLSPDSNLEVLEGEVTVDFDLGDVDMVESGDQFILVSADNAFTGGSYVASGDLFKIVSDDDAGLIAKAIANLGFKFTVDADPFVFDLDELIEFEAVANMELADLEIVSTDSLTNEYVSADFTFEIDTADNVTVTISSDVSPDFDEEFSIAVLATLANGTKEAWVFNIQIGEGEDPNKSGLSMTKFDYSFEDAAADGLTLVVYSENEMLSATATATTNEPKLTFEDEGDGEVADDEKSVVFTTEPVLEPGTYTFKVTATLADTIVSDDFTIKVVENIPPTKGPQAVIDALKGTPQYEELHAGLNFLINGGVAGYGNDDVAEFDVDDEVEVELYFLMKNTDNPEEWVMDPQFDGSGNLLYALFESYISNTSGVKWDIVVLEEDISDGFAKVTLTKSAIKDAKRGTDLEDGKYTLAAAVKDEEGTRSILKIEITEETPPPPSGYPSTGSSGCDAGFGAFALLALGAAVVLRKKD